MNFAIIVAAGKSARMGKNANKLFLPLLNKPLIYYAIKSFQDCHLIDEIIVVAQKENTEKILEIKKFFQFGKIKKIAKGGKERQDSAYNGLVSIKGAKSEDIVVVHNGCNPLVKENEIADCINAAKQHGASAAGFELKDTIKKADKGFVEKTVDRRGIYQMQTPQAVKYGLFVEAYKNAKKKKLKATDDVSLVEAMGGKVKIVPCSGENIKITTQDDLKIAEGILRGRGNFNCNFRAGFGHDSHKFSDEGKPLALGGCIIPNEEGLEANSDGDVILHALFNAISSAIGEGSLGCYADDMWEKGIKDSKEYLRVIIKRLNQKYLKINNISVSIEASKPKLEMHTDKIKDSLSKILDLDKSCIGITCTSGDRLTSFGQGKGMQCFAVVTVGDKRIIQNL